MPRIEPGLLGEKQECYLCAMQPTPLPRFSIRVCWSEWHLTANRQETPSVLTEIQAFIIESRFFWSESSIIVRSDDAPCHFEHCFEHRSRTHAHILRGSHLAAMPVIILVILCKRMTRCSSGIISMTETKIWIKLRVTMSTVLKQQQQQLLLLIQQQ